MWKSITAQGRFTFLYHDWDIMASSEAAAAAARATSAARPGSSPTPARPLALSSIRSVGSSFRQSNGNTSVHSWSSVRDTPRAHNYIYIKNKFKNSNQLFIGDTYTVETGYNVAFCSRHKWLYMRIYVITSLSLLLKGILGLSNSNFITDLTL